MYSIHPKTCHNSTHADLGCKMSTKTNEDFETKFLTFYPWKYLNVAHGLK